MRPRINMATDNMSLFDIDPSVAQFDVPYEDCLSDLQKSIPQLSGIATGAIIFRKFTIHNEQQQPRMLLIQRACHDSRPNKWEVPGGAVDAGETVLEGLAREVREESGLHATRVQGLVKAIDGDGGIDKTQGGDLFLSSRGRQIVKYTFVINVDAASKVRLDPNEHQDYVWATEDECRNKRVARLNGSELVLQFTAPAQEEAILMAFAEYGR